MHQYLGDYVNKAGHHFSTLKICFFTENNAQVIIFSATMLDSINETVVKLHWCNLHVTDAKVVDSEVHLFSTFKFCLFTENYVQVFVFLAIMLDTWMKLVMKLHCCNTHVTDANVGDSEVKVPQEERF